MADAVERLHAYGRALVDESGEEEVNTLLGEGRIKARGEGELCERRDDNLADGVASYRRVCREPVKCGERLGRLAAHRRRAESEPREAACVDDGVELASAHCRNELWWIERGHLARCCGCDCCLRRCCARSRRAASILRRGRRTT